MSSLSTEAKNILKQYVSKDDIVIIAPLNWGLGHATRCIPIIEFLDKYCRRVIIASDGPSLLLLQQEFPHHQFFKLPSYGISYKFRSILLNIIYHLPSIIYGMVREKNVAKKIVDITKSSVIISDNRIGFRCKGINNYYLSHQINIWHPKKLISTLGSKLHQFYIKKFDICFIPDFEGQRSLCPALTQNNNINKRYLGPLSRIGNTARTAFWDICAIISGPEPQRSYFENELLEQLSLLTNYKIIFVRGSDLKLQITNVPDHISIENFANSAEIEKILNSSKLLIARSGYSTIMDIFYLDIKAIFIPTPGQTEQEYLSQCSNSNPKYSVILQNEVIKLEKTIISLI